MFTCFFSECKLGRLKGKSGKELTSKDMLKSLEAVREDVNNRLSLPDDGNNFQSENATLETKTIFSQLQQKIHPESVAINAEELQKLIENDQLQTNLNTT